MTNFERNPWVLALAIGSLASIDLGCASPASSSGGAGGPGAGGAATSAASSTGTLAGGGASSGDGGASSDGGGGDTTTHLPDLTFCVVSNPQNASDAFTAQTNPDWVNYACRQTCSDWHGCVFGVVDAQGAPTLSARAGQPLQGLAFVVDGMAGHFVFTPDGTDVIVSHAGDGGTGYYNGFDRQLQATSDLKTVTLGWEAGVTALPGGGFDGGTGWFTRKDANGTSVRALVARPAAALAWVQANFAQGHKFGTVGHSMGTWATLGAHVWYGLDSILDYQMLIGGPGAWDINAGCGRVHISQGHCDTDVSPCTGNPDSSYGDQDPVCPGGDSTNNCRVPTVMAPVAGGSEYNNIINYVDANTLCAPTAPDSRDSSLDASSMAFTVPSWSFKGRVDFIADEGGAQPPNADQGMGEGHMMYMYSHITGAKGWIDNEGTHHPDAWKGNACLDCVEAAVQAVVTGMSQ